MNVDGIDTTFDDGLNTFIVHFPGDVTHSMLAAWACFFRAELQQHRFRKGVSILLDSNRHRFESIACLQFLRHFLEEVTGTGGGVGRVAFVQPVQYRCPEIVSRREAYFSTVSEAKSWLRG